MNELRDRCKTGAFVISLDFELHWGFFDHRLLTPELKKELEATRDAVEAMLDLFMQRGIHVSWAMVGLLMLENAEQAAICYPPEELRPHYTDSRFDPYAVPKGDNEEDDPYHYAASLLRKIIETPSQSLASHTFSHYYCLEAGQTYESFAADTDAAVSAAALYGKKVRSIVFPRNQYNPAYKKILEAAGIEAYRGNPDHCFYTASDNSSDRALFKRAGRMLDSYVPVSGSNSQTWDELYNSSFPLNVRASRFLRPWSQRMSRLEPLKLHRITRSMRAAASKGEIYHLWWHPHNFSVNWKENLTNLKLILDEYERCKNHYSMISLNIDEIIDTVKDHSKIS